MSLEALGALQEPVRRRVYECVAVASAPVGRDEVADAVGIGRTLAAFHLDKLAAAGLVEISFARRSGRTGPGAGRPAKLYRRSAVEHTVSVPPRDYRGLAEMLAEAVEEAGLEPVVYAAARRWGATAARTARRPSGDEPASAAPSGGVPAAPSGGGADGGGDLVGLLCDLGYEPVLDGDVIRLRNCPFDAVARAHPPVVCGANLALIEGALTANALTGRARLDPRPGNCCVVVDCKNN